MIKDFILPDIGEGVVDCQIVEWLVKEGDTVIEDQPIVDVMTDKALVQIPAPHAGVIDKLYYQKGDIAKVDSPLYAVSRTDDAEQDKETPDIPVCSEPSSAEPDIIIDENDSSQQLLNAEAPIPMVEDFLLPEIGDGISECELVEWLVEEGDFITTNQAIADVMADKALIQIPAIKTGKIVKLHYRKGQLAKINSPLFSMEVMPLSMETKDDFTTDDKNQPATSIGEFEFVNQGKALASPAVRRLARCYDIDITRVQGSGKQGRVYKDDIERYRNDNNIESRVIDLKRVDNTDNMTPYLIHDRVEAIEGVPAIMAKMMTESAATIPHFTYCEELDLTNLVQLRESIKHRYANDQLKITLMPFFMKAMSLALHRFPVVNSRVNSQCTELTYIAAHNIGMAVDSEAGLLVPNIKNVQQKSILEIAKEVTRLTTAARSGRVSHQDLKNGTISISNIGALGGTITSPIINKPEVAIVALGRIQRLPRFNDDNQVEARHIMQISWSGDHRVIDGGTIARFCNLWKQYLEQPQEMLLAIG